MSWAAAAMLIQVLNIHGAHEQTWHGIASVFYSHVNKRGKKNLQATVHINIDHKKNKTKQNQKTICLLVSVLCDKLSGKCFVNCTGMITNVCSPLNKVNNQLLSIC